MASRVALAKAALLFATLCAALLFAAPVYAEEASSDDKIHIMTLEGSDAIIIESNGVFGMVDSGEDDDYPDGSDPRYPLRPGITQGHGHQDEVVAYMRSIGVTEDNFDFYIGTHPHSDHIGSADEVIRAFHPKRVYVPEYKDKYISYDPALWDNRYVYDRMIEAAYEVGATVIWGLDSSAPVFPEMPDAELGGNLEPEGDGPGNVEDDGSGSSDGLGGSNGSGEVDDPSDSDNVGQAGQDSVDLNSFAEDEADGERAAEAYVLGDPNGSWAGRLIEDGPKPQHDPVTLDEAAGLDFQRNDIAAASDMPGGPVGTIGNPCFMLGDFSIEIMNYGDDYKTTPVADANWFSWGVKVSAYGKTAFLAGDIGNYDGDEDRLAVQLGHVDVLKMGHHGLSSSSTPEYLSALAPDYAMWTSDYATLPSDRLDVLSELGTRVWNSASSALAGCDAVVFFFGASGVVAEGPDEAVVEERDESPFWTAYQRGAKTPLSGWVAVGDSWLWFDGSSHAVENSWVSYQGFWYYVGEDALMRTGWVSDGSAWYLMDSSGRMMSGGWVNDGTGWYWLRDNGAMLTGWLSTGGHWYWMDSSGRMQTGIVTVDGTEYYFDDSGRMVEYGWISVSDGQVGLVGPGGAGIALHEGYIDGSGVHLAALSGLYGWQVFEERWVFVKDNGALNTGWIYTGGTAYKLDEAGFWVENPGKVLNVDRARLVSWLWSHEGDGYYLGTPYSSGFSISTCMYPSGAPRWDGFSGMNCTGFVAHAYGMSGGVGEFDAIGQTQSYSPWLGGPGGGSYINAWRWYGYAVEHGAEVYTFDSVSSMLASGKAEKGDIIFFKTNGSIDCHIGFFWGDAPSENKMWHQIYPYNCISACFNNANKAEVNQQTVLIKGC
ncbi:MBL fold metallo-hydrolase [Slackia piriformis]